MMKRSYMPPQIQMHHNMVMPIIMAASGDTVPPKKQIVVSDNTVGNDGEYWFRAKHYNVWDDSEAFSK